MMKVCKICGDEFTPKRSNAQFCPKDHYRPCLNCGEDYPVKKVVTPPKFCSSSCSAQYRNDNVSSEKVCKLCGDTFTSTNANSKFCSKVHTKKCYTCSKEFEITNPSKVSDCCSHTCSVNSKHIEKKCKRCNKSFIAKNAKTVYCDRDHYSNCEICDTPILLKQPKRVTRFCSQACTAKNSSYTSTCELCGSDFTSFKKGSKFCDQDHYTDCSICDNPFMIKNKYSIPDTCSPECAAQTIDFEARTDKTVQTLLEKYGVTNSYQLPSVISKSRLSAGRRVSKLNFQWRSDLEEELGIHFELEERFSGNSYADLGFKDILVDVNPSISHNSSINFLHRIKYCTKTDCLHTPKAVDYHHNRFLEAEASGKTLLQHFDWYDKEIFTSIIRSKLKLDENRIYAKKTTLKEIPQVEANKFFQENHLLGRASKQTLCVGLFVDDVLVHCNTYGPARLNKNYEWEAIRSASKMNWQVHGGFSKCDSHFFKTRNPKSVVSYVDLAISTGSTELMFPGWTLKSTNSPSATWVNLSGNKDLPQFVKANSVWRLSADRLLGYEVGDKYPSHHPDGSVFTNDDVLVAEGFVKVFDAGTRTFTWSPPEE